MLADRLHQTTRKTVMSLT